MRRAYVSLEVQRRPWFGVALWLGVHAMCLGVGADTVARWLNRCAVRVRVRD